MKKVLSIALVSAMALTVLGATTANTVDAATTIDSTHVSVVKGDSYKTIAEANNTTVAELEQANGREIGGFDLIYPGETITLPSASSTTANNTSSNTTVAQDTTTQATPAATSTPAASTATTTQAATTSTASTTGTSKGTFKISFYDPAVLGSNMGYSGVAANLSVFPKGTQLKITLSDGTVLYRTVNDTGTFANSNSQQLDVAMPSSSIPSYGVTTASVEVLS
ncbi:DPBB and LysM peptidoglycan-binding domain-containing protein [Companilactobacillus hulinensis]|uniref:DPBB and LysM peptidoglycan-binding domain-containing protein n=1 Tax=Companilactobacillus hulinensis TaxID=2486007 RepID=UPI000F7680D7|nr:LysM peptidoglycan-binding domain-containing protein [Companilactobacillus hulinensis]